MIKQLQIENFKALRKVKLDLAPITVLIGPNNAGKSSILHTLSFLKQSIGKRPNYSEPYVSLGDFKRTVHGRESSSKIMIKIRFELSTEDIIDIQKLDLPAKGLAIYPEDLKELEYTVQIDDRGVEIQAVRDRSHRLIFKAFGERISDSGVRWNVNYLDHPEQLPGKDLDEIIGWEVEQHPSEPILPKLANQMRAIIHEALMKMVYIPVNRGFSDWYYEIESEMPQEAALGSGKAANVVFYLQNRRDQGRAYEEIRKWAKIFGFEDIVANVVENRSELPSELFRAEDRRFMFLDGYDPNLKIPINIVASGFGINQLLAVIIQTLYAPFGSVITIEEPEMSLHPRYQVKLSDLFLTLFKEQKQVLVTTHSEHVLMGIQTKIAKQELSPKLVAIWYVHREKGETKAEKLEIREDGSIVGGLPGFFEVDKELLKTWSRHIAEREID